MTEKEKSELEKERQELENNPWAKKTLNLTRQAEILKTDPKLAGRLQATAKRQAEKEAEQARQGSAGQTAQLPKSVAIINASGRKKKRHTWMP